MENVYLDCMPREEKGKGKMNALRRSGFVPAVVYGQGKNTLSIKLDQSKLIKFIHAHHGAENMIITLRISDKAKAKIQKREVPVLIKEIQYHPVRDNILHIDFNEISLTKTIKVKVRILQKGEAVGVKQEGGVLSQILWDLEVECLPTQIPEKIEVDVTNMKIGDSVQVKNLVVPEGITIITDKEGFVFNLTHPKKVEEVVAEAPVEGAAPVEPEVIKKEKKEEETIEETKPEKEAVKKEAPKKEAPKEK